MNKVVLIGRLTKELELRYTTTEKAFLRCTVAVDRMKKEDGADFINCVVWGKTAEVMAKYCNKGDKVAFVGHIQTGSYEKNGVKQYTTDVVVESLDFIETKKTNGTTAKAEKSDGFTPADQDPFGDEGLPFNSPF